MRKNFVSHFMGLFPKELGATEIEDFDFSLIKEHLLKQRELRLARSTEEKKKILAEKQAEEAKYRYCLFNKELEKVSNSLVEPPGIFRGRGEHPHAGSLKSRIIPEMVTINTGIDDAIPKCPVVGHCWETVVENKEAAWLATFKDERASYALRKYINLAADSKIKGENDKKKYEKARRLKAEIAKIRANYIAAMESQSTVDN